MSNLNHFLKKFIGQHTTIIIIFLWLAFALRIWGLDFGLPYRFHPDEYKYVDSALGWHTAQNLNLKLINPPLYTYILVIADWFWFALSPFEKTEAWQTGAYFFARLWSVGLSMVTVSLTYTTAKKLADKKAGVVALILLSGTFLPIREAHFAVNDSSVALMTLLTLYFCLRLYHSTRMVDYLLVGMALGLAAAAKLTGGIVLVSVVLTFGLLKKKNYLFMGLSLWGAAITFLLVSAHIFWQLPEFINAVNTHLDFGSEGYHGLKMAPGSGWLFYGSVLGWGMGWGMVAVSTAAVLKNIIRPASAELILVIFSVVMFMYMGAQKIVFARFLLPIVPVLAILAAVYIVNTLLPRLPRQIPSLLMLGTLLAALLVQPVVTAAWADHLLTMPDTRLLATDWFISRFPPKTPVAREKYSSFPKVVFISRKWSYKISDLFIEDRLQAGVDYYGTRAATLIIISNFTSGRILQDAAEQNLSLSQLDYLNKNLILIKEFNPYQSGYQQQFFMDELYGPAGETLQRWQPGPLIKIYAKPCVLTGNGCPKLLTE